MKYSSSNFGKSASIKWFIVEYARVGSCGGWCSCDCFGSRCPEGCAASPAGSRSAGCAASSADAASCAACCAASSASCAASCGASEDPDELPKYLLSRTLARIHMAVSGVLLARDKHQMLCPQRFYGQMKSVHWECYESIHPLTNLVH